MIQKLLKNPKIFIPIIVILIGVLVVGVVFVLIEVLNKQPEPQPGPTVPDGSEPRPDDSGQKPNPQPKPKPQPNENPWEGCKEIIYDPNVDYNFMGTLNVVQADSPAQFLEIKKDQEKRMFSLGKYKLPLETNAALRVTKLWLYFFSEKLSDREDNLYGLEDSYLSRIVLKVGNKSKEINLGRSGEHSFIELSDCPLGNIQAIDYETELTFEILLEIGCNNFKSGECLDNDGKPLDYIDGAELTAQMRFFAISADEFYNDLSVSTKFKYE